MSEKEAKESPVEPEKPVDPPQEPDRNEHLEALAGKMGWNPDHKGENFVDAEQFILNTHEINRGLSNKLRDVNREMKALRESVDMIADFNAKAAETSAKKAQSEIERLENEKLAAVEDGDKERFKQIEAQIKELHAAAAAKPANTTKKSPSPAYVAWIEGDGAWYESNKEMRQWADNYFDKFMPSSVKALPLDKQFAHITKEAMAVYPEAFKSDTDNAQPSEPAQTKQQVSRVAEPSRRSAGKKKQYTFDDLSFYQKKIAEQMVDQLRGTPKEMTKDQYAHELLSGGNK